jgi:hypothetical protein
MDTTACCGIVLLFSYSPSEPALSAMISLCDVTSCTHKHHSILLLEVAVLGQSVSLSLVCSLVSKKKMEVGL